MKFSISIIAILFAGVAHAGDTFPAQANIAGIYRTFGEDSETNSTLVDPNGLGKNATMRRMGLKMVEPDSVSVTTSSNGSTAVTKTWNKR